MEPQYTYDPVTNEYRDDQTGEVVAAAIILAWLLMTSQNAGRSARELTQLLRQGEISLKAWQLEMSSQIRYAHLANAAAAKGGLLQLTMADYVATQKIIARELTFLDRFAKGMADGSIPMDGHVLARADQYMLAGRETYADFQRREMVKRGFDEEMNKTSTRESCDPKDGRPGCADESARGWVSAGSLSLPGSRGCYANCQCRIVYRNSATGQVVG